MIASPSSPSEEFFLTTADRVFLSHDPKSRNALVDNFVLQAEQPCECNKQVAGLCKPCYARKRVGEIWRLVEEGIL